MPGIYRITCEGNKKQYIGSTKNSFEKRKGNHWTALRRGKHRNPVLQAAWNKYGEEAFSWHVILECDESVLLQEEDRLMRLHNTLSPNGFNLKEAERPVITDETRAKMSASKMGEKNSFYGKKHTPEVLQILKEKCGHEMTDEIKEKQSKGMSRKWSDPDAAWNSKEYKETAATRLRDPNHPMHLASRSPEACQKRSEQMTKYWQENDLTEERREKLRQAALRREASKTPEQKAEISRKISEARRKARTPQQQ
jgi:group I intron endonuclease